MISHINHQYISSCTPEWIAKLVVTLATNNHLVDCTNETKNLIMECVRQHAGTIDIELVSNAPLYEITLLKRKYLTTIEVDGSFTPEEYLNLFGNPSFVLVENGPYEWPVYKMMMDVYKKDKEYKNIYAVLLKASNGPHRTLQELHAGGNGTFEALINLKEESPEYKGLTRYKIYPVTDSDRESENASYQPTPKKLYHLFCGINNKTDIINRDFIDTLAQPLYNWHMWRKRAIENYFPPEAYEKIGLNADKYRNYSIPERYFKNVEHEIVGYEKKNLKCVAKSMSRKDYEDISDKLIIDGNTMSEIQLFLLKMAKVV